MIYVSHKYGGDTEEYEKAAKITRILQVTDPDMSYGRITKFDRKRV